MEEQINSTKPALLVLAAGMGSRYGGLKQMDEFGPNGETILDYSIYDAIKAGFGKVVFVIRASFEQDFRDFFKDKFEDKVEIEFVCQELTTLPESFASRSDFPPSERQKPWGTAHAVYVAKDVINEPFAVINADDFYGGSAYKVVVDFFNSENLKDKQDYALIGYDLVNTLSDHGTVNRGICEVDENDNLIGIVETLKIGYDDDRRIFHSDTDGNKVYLKSSTPASMNLWAFYPNYFDYCEQQFEAFLTDHGTEEKSEFFIPLLIDYLTQNNLEQVKVLSCKEDWFGVTYQEDKPIVMQRLQELINKGVYPSKLWD